MRSLSGLLACLALACATPKPNPSESTLPDKQAAETSPLISDPVEYALEAASVRAGEAIFSRTGIGDPYGTGVPFPVFLAVLEAYPDELGPDLPSFVKRFGFLARERDETSADDDVRAGLPVGMHLTTDPFTSVPFLVTNCTLCHAERVEVQGEPRVVTGLGNKRVRLHAYDAAWTGLGARTDLSVERLAPFAAEAAREYSASWPSQWASVFLKASVKAFRERAQARGDFLKRVGASPPGLVAVIESFAWAMERTLARPVPTGEHVGWSKIPDVIGYRHRSTLSFDGAGVGSKDALVVEADFAAGARLAWYWAHPLQGPSLSLYLNQLRRDLPFPGSIDAARAERGKATFKTSCTPCHGEYGPDGYAFRYEEKVVPISVVGSDATRAEAVTPAYVEAGNDPKLTHGLVQTRRTLGYVAPVLTDIWARAPYGHAGQWSSLAVLAEQPGARSTRFIADLSGKLDLTLVGVPVRPMTPGTPPREGELLIDASEPGRGVQGHPFLADLPHESRRDVIEYLKTL